MDTLKIKKKIHPLVWGMSFSLKEEAQLLF